MKKKGFKILAITLLIVGVFSVGVFAGTNMQAITAYLNYGITIEYNDVDQSMTDESGTRVYPITYNGTTYLPVRAVSNMLGLKVDWDAATNHVLLGESYPDAASEHTSPQADFDFTFIADSINTYGNGKLVLSTSSAECVDENGIWLGNKWDGENSGEAYVFPSISFVSSSGSGVKVAEMPIVYNAITNALKSRGYTIAKIDQSGMEHYVNGPIEFKICNVNNNNTDMQIEVRTNWQSCCAEGSGQN